MTFQTEYIGNEMAKWLQRRREAGHKFHEITCSRCIQGAEGYGGAGIRWLYCMTWVEIHSE
jgi:hypothetical protein